MTFDFDEIVDRRETGSSKWEKYKGKDIIPMWVADMDFKVPPVITQALRQKIDHGIFGYVHPSHETEEIIVSRLSRLYEWNIEKEWIVWLSGLVSGVNATCRAFGNPGDEIMTTIPVYPPFLTAPKNSEQKLVTVPLIENNGRLTLDFDAIEKAITEKTSLFILCSPYNPCGTIFTQEELNRLVTICADHNIVLVSDEIHADFILDEDRKHIPTATLSQTAAKTTVTLMAPSKTYNIAGLSCSYAIIPNSTVRNKFLKSIQGIMPHVNCMGLAATQAAYQGGDEWFSELILYLRGNRDLLLKEINAINGLSLNPISATYLAWIDVRELKLENPVKYFEDHGVGLSCGKDFGTTGFVRLNFGCPRSVLKEAIKRIKKAIREL